MIAGMEERLPLSALLSQALAAFIIEFDNEFEHRAPHRTTNHGSTAGSPSAPWLVSMVMWSKFVRFVPEGGISVRELKRLTGTPEKEMRMWLTRLSKWWGYLVIEGDAVRPSAGGLKAIEVWQPLTGIIEKRWEERFGADAVDRLRLSMKPVVNQFENHLPDSLPILGYDLCSKVSDGTGAKTEQTLPGLLSKILLAFAIEFERQADISLAISANVLRLTGPDGVLVRELPRLSGVSKEAIAMAAGRLQQRGLAMIQSRKLLLTSRGREAQEACGALVWAIEKQWETRLGTETIAALRESLERLVGPRLFRGLEPYPDGWRALVPQPAVLPHYPMILHRGGFPDGS
jgi:hypothetical protein